MELVQLMKSKCINFVVVAILAMTFSVVGACTDGQGINNLNTTAAGLNADGTGGADNCEVNYNPPSEELGKSCTTWEQCVDVAPTLASGASAPVFCPTVSDVTNFGWDATLVGTCVAQADLDGDGAGDVCDGDVDGDHVPNDDDNCPTTPNANQADLDDDGIGDACDLDDDGDGVNDDSDNCPSVPNADQADTDNDGVGNACEDDSDGDGVPDSDDNCPTTPNANQADLDDDGIGDACDLDDDGDGVNDNVDNCPSVPNADQADTDNDGVGNACDGDDDGDTIPDGQDNCPLVANRPQTDTDHDGIGDACDPDRDGDGVLNSNDNCPDVANANQADSDEDGVGDVCDLDCDNDGVPATCDPDADGDGYSPNSSPKDCVEGDASIHPGAAERCNGVDDDCDGQTDEGLDTLCGMGEVCMGYGGCLPAQDGCESNADCDDNNTGTVDVCNTETGACTHTTPPTDECTSNSQCLTSQVCIANKCRNKAQPGQCSPFAIKVVKGGTENTYLEWYGTQPTPTRSGRQPDGTYQSEAGECSVSAFDFASDGCYCYTTFGTSPCAELPASPGVWGCRHNQQ